MIAFLNSFIHVKKIRRILIRLINIKFMCLISLNIHFQKRVFATPKDSLICSLEMFPDVRFIYVRFIYGLL